MLVFLLVKDLFKHSFIQILLPLNILRLKDAIPDDLERHIGQGLECQLSA